MRGYAFIKISVLSVLLLGTIQSHAGIWQEWIINPCKNTVNKITHVFQQSEKVEKATNKTNIFSFSSVFSKINSDIIKPSTCVFSTVIADFSLLLKRLSSKDINKAKTGKPSEPKNLGSSASNTSIKNPEKDYKDKDLFLEWMRLNPEQYGNISTEPKPDQNNSVEQQRASSISENKKNKKKNQNLETKEMIISAEQKQEFKQLLENLCSIITQSYKQKQEVSYNIVNSIRSHVVYKRLCKNEIKAILKLLEKKEFTKAKKQLDTLVKDQLNVNCNFKLPITITSKKKQTFFQNTTKERLITMRRAKGPERRRPTKRLKENQNKLMNEQKSKQQKADTSNQKKKSHASTFNINRNPLAALAKATKGSNILDARKKLKSNK